MLRCVDCAFLCSNNLKIGLNNDSSINLGEFMKLTVMTLAIFLSASVFAHFEIGTYMGTDQNGNACKVVIKGVTFTNNEHHPLNENVEIEVPFHAQTRTFSHLAIVDESKGTVRPKKEILSSVNTTSVGAAAYELTMDSVGPSKMVYMEDNYKDRAQSSMKTCSELLFTGN